MARLTEDQKNERKLKLKQEARTAGIIAKYGVAGYIGGIPDLVGFTANVPSYIGNALGGDYKVPYEYITPKIAQGIDELTGNALEPQDFTQRALGTAGEFAGAGKAQAFPKAASYLSKFIAPQNIKDYGALLGIGVGVETAREIKPDSTLAQILGGIAGGSIFNTVGVLPNLKQKAINYSNEGFNPPPGNLAEAIKTKEAAARIGTHVTPAEASGNPFLAAKEARLGVNKENAQLLYDKKIANFNNQNTAIDNLYESISPTNNKKKMSADEAIRETAKKIMADEKTLLKEKADPHYAAVEEKLVGKPIVNTQKSREYTLDAKGNPVVINKTTKTPGESTTLPKSISKDPTITDAINAVFRDKNLQVELEGFDKHSVKVLDLAKRKIDSDINKAKVAGDEYKVAALVRSKERLTNAIDKQYPMYAKARSIYEEGTPYLEKTEGSSIGKIARREDATTKNIGKDLFDPAQTNHEAFLEVRDKLLKEDPEAWYGIVRQEMERRVGSTKEGGFNFFNKIARDKKIYRQFHDALEGRPISQQKLADMERAFRNILDPVTPRTAAGLAKSSLDVSRSTGELLEKMIRKYGGKKIDEAAIELIMNPDWDKEFQSLRRLPDQADRAYGMSVILNSVIQSSKENEKEKAPQESTPQAEGVPNYNEISEEDAIKDFIRRGDFSKLSKEELTKLKDRYESIISKQQ